MGQHLKNQVYKIRCCSCVVAIVGTGLAIYESEILSSRGNIINSQCNVLKALVSALTAVLLLMVQQVYVLRVRIGICECKFPADTTIWTSALLPSLASELLLCGLHSPPFFHVEFATIGTSDFLAYRTFDSCITVVMTLRLYLFFAPLTHIAGTTNTIRCDLRCPYAHYSS